MEDQFRRPAMVAAVTYENPKAALDWLEKVFGLKRVIVLTTPDDEVAHAEMKLAGGLIYVGGIWGDHTASPLSLGGKNTQSVHVLLHDGLDAHCERARAAGATIIREPEDQFYGDRVYGALDVEGHYWSFAQVVRTVSREEAEQTSGLKIEGWV